MKAAALILSACLFLTASFPKLADAGRRGGSYRSGTSGYYKSTGVPKVHRSQSEKGNFLRERGYDKVPRGYEVDHVVPLHKGGADKSYNMQLLPKELHQRKTAEER